VITIPFAVIHFQLIQVFGVQIICLRVLKRQFLPTSLDLYMKAPVGASKNRRQGRSF